MSERSPVYYEARDLVNSDRQTDLHNLAKESNTACVFVSAYDAFHYLYPEKMFPRSNQIWKEIETIFPQFETKRIPPNQFLETATTIFNRLDLDIKKLHVVEGFAGILGMNEDSSSLRFQVHPSGGQLELNLPYTLLYSFYKPLINHNSLHLVTMDGSKRSQTEIQELNTEGWEVNAVLELQKKQYDALTESLQPLR